MNDKEPVFDTPIPVFVDRDNESAIGSAKGYRDLETGNVQIVIDFNEAASNDIEGIMHILSTKALVFAGMQKISEPESELPIYCNVGSCDAKPGHIGQHRCRCGKLVTDESPGCVWHKKVDESELDKSMSRHPAGSKQRQHTAKEKCDHWADGHSYKICSRDKGHEGPHG